MKNKIKNRNIYKNLDGKIVTNLNELNARQKEIIEEEISLINNNFQNIKKIIFGKKLLIFYLKNIFLKATIIAMKLSILMKKKIYVL